MSQDHSDLYERVNEVLENDDPELHLARSVLLRLVAELTYDLDDGMGVFAELACYLDQISSAEEMEMAGGLQ